MATHSSSLAWEITWTEEPGRLQSWGHRVGHDLATKPPPPLACITVVLVIKRASLVAQMVKSRPAIQETWVWSLGWEDPLEKGMATHSSSLAWEIPWTEEPVRLQSMRSKELDTIE